MAGTSPGAGRPGFSPAHVGLALEQRQGADRPSLLGLSASTQLVLACGRIGCDTAWRAAGRLFRTGLPVSVFIRARAVAAWLGQALAANPSLAGERSFGCDTAWRGPGRVFPGGTVKRHASMTGACR